MNGSRRAGQARGDAGASPYYETFGYDAFSNLTGRQSNNWNQDVLLDGASYTNNRRAGWGYDADGRNTAIDTRQYNFAAAGQMTLMTGQRWVINHYVATSQAAGYDGDGAKVQEVLNGASTYYLTSSALGGAIIEELSSTGQKNVGYVYLPGGQMLARQVPAGSSSYIAWKHATPAGTGQFDYNVGGAFGAGVPQRIELDPLGADVGIDAPAPPDTGGGQGDLGGSHVGGIMDARWSDFFNLSSGCSALAVAASCSGSIVSKKEIKERKKKEKGVRPAILRFLAKGFKVTEIWAGGNLNKLLSAARAIRLAATCIVIGLLLTTVGNTQKSIEPPRVGLEFRCPTYTIACCQPMTLQADVFGAKQVLGAEQAKLIAYRWEVSGGKIVSGQGTTKVTIDAAELPSNSVQAIRVTLRLDGGPPELEKEKSCTLTIDPKCPLPRLFDQYGDLSLTDEKLRLDRLAEYLKNEGAGSVAFLVAYAGLESCFWEAELRAERAKKYLINDHKIQADRVMAIDGGFRENLTMDLFTSPCQSCGPFPAPTLLGSEANVKRSCGDKYKETVRP